MRPAHRALLAVLLAASLGSPLSHAATPNDTPNDTPPETPAGTAASPEVSGGVLPLLPEGSKPTNVSGGVLPLLPEPETPAVARDVGVEELPLLVTEPPKKQAEVVIPAPVTGGADSTLNPFSPLLLPQVAEPAPPPAPPVAAPPAAPTPTPPPVAAPPTQPAPAPSVATPAPRPAAPVPPARTTRPTLPRSLAASLRVPAPPLGNPAADPLARALGAQSVETNALGPSSTLAAIRIPPSLTPLGTAPAVDAAAAPIPSSAQQVALGSGLTALGLNSSDGNFTSLGGNRVSRALSSLQVHFTAMTTGTAIFRVGDDTTPLLLALGESLPGTKLTLTSLTNRGAQFTEDDVRHTLFLTP